MLTILSFAAIHACSACPVPHGRSIDLEQCRYPARSMSDTIPDWGNRFGFPFTRDEFIRAHLLVDSREVAEAMAYPIYSPEPGEFIGVSVMDGTLLLLAALSDAVAERVVAYRPGLKGEVERIRADPKRFIDSLRRRDEP